MNKFRYRIFIICILIMACSGCKRAENSDLPEYMTQNAYEKGIEALEVIDSYLVNGISRDNAIQKLNAIADEITYTKEEYEQYYKAHSVKVFISSLSQKLNSFGSAGWGAGGNRILVEQALSSALEDIEETRDKLAELLEVE